MNLSCFDMLFRNKAVSDGALSFYRDRFLRFLRIPRFNTNLTSAFLDPPGRVSPPRDRTKEELHHTKPKLTKPKYASHNRTFTGDSTRTVSPPRDRTNLKEELHRALAKRKYASHNRTSTGDSTGPASPPRGRTKEELHRILTKPKYASHNRTFTGDSTGPASPPRGRTKEELSLQQLEYKFRRARIDNANLHRNCFELDRENRRNKDTIRSLQNELTHIARRELQENKDMSDRNRRQKDTIRNLQCELQEYKNVSDSWHRELIGTQVFLTKADLLSISDVKDKVNALNDEKFQASASLGDSLVHFKYELAKEEKEAAYAEVCRTMSEPLARALTKETQKPEPEVNPLLVQVVLEIYLVHFCSSMIASWFPGNLETSDFLTTMYSEIRRTGESIIVRYRLPLISFFRGTSCLR